MKWSIELDNKLKELIYKNKNHYQIADILGTTNKSVSNRCFRLGLKIKHKKEYRCKNCDLIFSDYENRDRKFCSNNCSAIFNNLGREHSIETKQKIKLKISGHTKSEETKQKISGPNNPNWVDGRSSINKFNKINGYKKCKHCGDFNVYKKYNRICDDCRMMYYKYYRPLCEFDFNFDDYSEFFNLDLVKRYGWYSPTNKGNNLNGVSRDHLYSVSDGFKSGINPEIIKHPSNCELILHKNNQSKNCKSSITLEELLQRINDWNVKYGN
jgi:hypothetical protein